MITIIYFTIAALHHAYEAEIRALVVQAQRKVVRSAQCHAPIRSQSRGRSDPAHGACRTHSRYCCRVVNTHRFTRPLTPILARAVADGDVQKRCSSYVPLLLG